MRGISHIAIGVRDMEKSLPFYRDVLGLRVVRDEVERMGGMSGVTDNKRRASRLVWDNGLWATYVVLSQSAGTASGTPSKLDQIGIHHFAFWVDDWNDLRTAADTCAYHGVHIETNPTRHGVTRGQCLYFFDPCGNRNEVYTGGYWVDPDAEPTPWTEAEMGRARFYYDGVVNQRFLTVHT